MNTKMEADILTLEEDDDTILLIVGDDELKIKQEIEDTNSPSESQDCPKDIIIKEEILDVTFEYPNEFECDENEDSYNVSFEYPNEFECNENEEDVDGTFEYLDESLCNEDGELLPVNKIEPDADYLNVSIEWEEKTRKKMLKPGQRRSLVKELKKKHPELAKDKTRLTCTLVDIMRSVKPPPLPLDYYVVNDIMLECIICSALTETIPAASRHYLEKHGPRYLFCYACGVNFRSRTTLYVHEKRCAAPDRDAVLRARAVMLGNKGKTRPYLGLAKAFKIRSPIGKFAKINKFACETCPAVFNSKEALKSHSHLHNGRRPYKCEECDNAYTSRGTLSRHVKREHRNQQFICDHCGRVFKVKEGLVTHMETHRPRELRKYPCLDCGHRFAQKHTMQRHVERKHTKAPPPCACQLCPERFRRTTLLKKHMKKEHGVVLMTQKMLYRALPTMTDEEVQKAMGYRLASNVEPATDL